MSLLDLVEGYDWDGSADSIEDMMRDFYPDVMALAYGDANGKLPVGVSFDLTNPRVQDTIDGLAKKIRSVAQTTRDDIKALVKKSTEDGMSIPDLAKAIREKGAISSKSRSEMIARTESREAYNGGALLAYDDAGVGKVEALDSDNDPECAERNGQVYTLEEAAGVEAHPNCQLAWSPVIE